MDIVYTDANRVEIGVIHNFEIDYDTTDKMDYVLTVGINNNVLDGNSWWYIDGTEYGGVVDNLEVKTESKQIEYSGRNFRSILASKVIEPAAGQDYRIVQGNLTDIVNQLLLDAAISDIFTADSCNVTVSSYQFPRYVNAYAGITALAKSVGKLVRFTAKYGVVHLSFVDNVDYSDEAEYNQKDIRFRIIKNFNLVNHLICLGQGELAERTVIHLYTDENGILVDEKKWFGMDEVTEVYDNTSAQSVEELREGGIERLKELNAPAEIEVTTDDTNLHIGDIVGGYEETTGYYVKAEIQNVVAKLNDSNVSLQYQVGGSTATITTRKKDVKIPYPVPWATKDVLGFAKIGDDFGIYEDGTLDYEVPESFTALEEQMIFICS